VLPKGASELCHLLLEIVILLGELRNGCSSCCICSGKFGDSIFKNSEFVGLNSVIGIAKSHGCCRSFRLLPEIVFGSPERLETRPISVCFWNGTPLLILCTVYTGAQNAEFSRVDQFVVRERAVRKPCEFRSIVDLSEEVRD